MFTLLLPLLLPLALPLVLLSVSPPTLPVLLINTPLLLPVLLILALLAVITATPAVLLLLGLLGISMGGGEGTLQRLISLPELLFRLRLLVLETSPVAQTLVMRMFFPDTDMEAGDTNGASVRTVEVVMVVVTHVVVMAVVRVALATDTVGLLTAKEANVTGCDTGCDVGGGDVTGMPGDAGLTGLFVTFLALLLVIFTLELPLNVPLVNAVFPPESMCAPGNLFMSMRSIFTTGIVW